METSSIGSNGGGVYERLCEEHRAMLALCDEQRVFCSSPDQPDWKAYDDFRWRFSRQAVQYLCFKDQYIYLNLQASGVAGIEQIVKRIRAEQDRHHGLVQAHILKWTQGSIRKDWRGYAAATRTLNVNLHKLLAMEAEQLHPIVRQQQEESLSKHSQVRNWAGEIWAVRDAIMKP